MQCVERLDGDVSDVFADDAAVEGEYGVVCASQDGVELVEGDGAVFGEVVGECGIDNEVFAGAEYAVWCLVGQVLGHRGIDGGKEHVAAYRAGPLGTNHAYVGGWVIGVVVRARGGEVALLNRRCGRVRWSSTASRRACTSWVL